MRLLAAVVVLLSIGCVPWYAPVRIENPDIAGQTRFPGIKRSLENEEKVRLLIVHGMGTHGGEPYPESYAHGLVTELQRQLSLTPLSQCKTVDKFDFAFGAASTVDRCTYTYATTDHELRVYILTWSKLTEVFEKIYVEPDWKQYGKYRVKGNRLLEKSVIDESFDDAVMYAGQFAPAMRATVRRALCVLLNDKTDSSDPVCELGDVGTFFARQLALFRNEQSDVFLISHSLGSIMVIETLQEMLAPDKPRDPKELFAQAEARDFIKNLRVAALMANQIPLIHMSRIGPDGQLPQPTAGAIKFGQEIAKKPAGERFSIVAFHDPNDLLTFPIPAGWQDRIAPHANGKAQIVNVFITTVPYRWLTVFVNPATARTKYWTNEYLVQLLVKGNS